jgi:hypothetical protein
MLPASSFKKRLLKIALFGASGIVLIIIGLFLFIKLDTQQAADFTDLTLRPLIGDSRVIALEKIFFNVSDDINQIKYTVVPPHNPFLGNEDELISASSSSSTASHLDLGTVLTTASTPLNNEGRWYNTPLSLFPNQIVAADTFIRPDPSRPYAFVTLVQMDMSKLQLWSVAGFKEPGGKIGKPGPGVIPQDIQSQGLLVAAFNGGFQYRDGQYGMIVDGTTYVPLKKDLATLVGHTDGRIEIVKYEGQNLGNDIAFVRQNCPMLIENGVIGPQDEGNKKLWGRTNTTEIYTWRSGLGITAKGNLVYAVGNSLIPSTLAAALKAAGAVNAIQLDINPVWVRFIFFNNYTKGHYSTSQIMEGVTNGSYADLHGYNKDFFYVTKK